MIIEMSIWCSACIIIAKIKDNTSVSCIFFMLPKRSSLPYYFLIQCRTQPISKKIYFVLTLDKIIASEIFSFKKLSLNIENLPAFLSYSDSLIILWGTYKYDYSIDSFFHNLITNKRKWKKVLGLVWSTFGTKNSRNMYCFQLFE